LNYRYQLLELF